MNIKRIAIVLAALVVLTGCGVNVSVNVDESGGASITVRLDEARLNELLRNSSASTERDGLLTEIEHVEFLEGRVRVSGVRVQPDGTRLNGSYDFAVSTNDGRLAVQIVAVDLAGFSMNDDRIARINTELTEALGRAASDAPNVRFSTVSVTDNALEFTIKVQR